MRFTLIAIALMGVTTHLQAELWTGPKGFNALMGLRSEIEVQTRDNRQLKEKNDRIAREIHSLKQGNLLIEEKARMELGMIRHGERFYQIARPDYVE